MGDVADCELDSAGLADGGTKFSDLLHRKGEVHATAATAGRLS